MSAQNGYKENLWKLKGIRFFFWMHFFAAILIPFFTEWGGLKLSEVLFLNSWFMLWNFLLEVPTGTVADFMGRKASLMFGCLSGGAAALLYVSKPDLYIFMLAEIVFAIAFTLHSGADEALAYDSLKAIGRENEAKQLLASLESYKLAGIIAGTTSGGFIAAKFGYSASMSLYSIPALLAFILACTLQEPSLEEKLPVRQGYLKILRGGIHHFLQHPVLVLLTAELVLTNALAWGLIWLFQPLLAESGLPVAAYGIVHALTCVGQIVFLNHVDCLETWLGSKRSLLVAATLVSGASFILLGVVHQWTAVILLIIAGFSFSLPRIPVFSAYMNYYIPSDKRATVLSLTSMCRTLAIVVINPVIGLLADWSLTYTMIILGAGLVIIGLFSRIEERHLHG